MDAVYRTDLPYRRPGNRAILSGASFTLPGFIWCLLIGVVLRNLEHIAPGLKRIIQRWIWWALYPGHIYRNGPHVAALVGIAQPGGPLLVMLLIQTVGMALFASLVTFRIMGANYDSAIMAGGHCGFGLGATPTAVANMEAITRRYGPRHRHSWWFH